MVIVARNEILADSWKRLIGDRGSRNEDRGSDTKKNSKNEKCYYHMTRTDPARNFLGKPYEKKSRMRAVRLALAGPEKAVRPY